MAVADYKQSIIRIARAKGIDPSFVAGIMHIESSGNPRAGIEKFAQRPDGSWYTTVNYGQGVGLMQVVPVEAAGNWAGRPSVSQLLDPDFSIDFGAQMLADNLQRCGTKEFAACAYFAGHCVPTGASDPNATDRQYIARAMAAEKLYLDYNGDDEMWIRLNGVASWWTNNLLQSGGTMQLHADFPALPLTARAVDIEVFLDPASAVGSKLVFYDGDGDPNTGRGYAGQVSLLRPETVIRIVPKNLTCLFSIAGHPRTALVGILGYLT